MAQTWAIEGATFLQDKVSVANSHVHLWEACFSIWALSASHFPYRPSSSRMPCRSLLLNDELQLKWSSLETMEKWPLELLRLYNCFIVSDCAHQRPLQVNFNFFWSQNCSYAFRKMAIFSFPYLIYLFSFYCSTCILWHWKSSKPFLLVAQFVFFWFELLRWASLKVIKAMYRQSEQ